MDNITKLEDIIRQIEVNKIYYEYQKNISDLTLKWHLGNMLKTFTKTKHSIALFENKLKIYGYAYSKSYLLYYRKYYNTYPKPMNFYMGVSFHHIRKMLSLKESDKYYYYSEISKKGLSAKDLGKLLKTKEYKNYSLKNCNIDNVLVIYEGKIDNYLKEIKMLATIKCFLSSLDKIYIVKESLYIQNSKVDYLLYSIEYNAYIVALIVFNNYYRKSENKLLLLTNYINKNYKKHFHNSTLGVIITNEEKYIKIYYYGTSNFTFKPYEIYYVNL